MIVMTKDSQNLNDITCCRTNNYINELDFVLL